MQKTMHHMIQQTLFIAMVTMIFASSESAAFSGVYGLPWNGGGLANLEIGRYGHAHMWCYRFRAEHDGPMREFRIFFKFDYVRPGYHVGDGGEIKFELREDDGTDNHLPGSAVLASVLVTDPLLEVPGSSTRGGCMRKVTLNGSVLLKKGVLYHMVMSNTHAEPRANYVSVNAIFNRDGLSNLPCSPVVPGADWATLCTFDGETWTPKPSAIPVLEIYYENGESQGLGYRESFESLSVGGPDMVRQTITPSDTDKIISRIGVRIQKAETASSGLAILLQTSDGKKIIKKTVAADSISSGWSWPEITLAAPITLSRGTAYHLVLSSANPGFAARAMEDASSLGFGPGSIFSDGQAQVSSGSSWTGNGYNDIQFYMILNGTK